MGSDRDLKAQLRVMDEQLTSMIGVADDRGDFLLGALLCDAHAHVVRRHAEIDHGMQDGSPVPSAH